MEGSLLLFSCLYCNESYEKQFKKYLAKRFGSIYKFCDGNISKFCLMLKKGVYFYEYIGSWQIFNNTKLQTKEEFCSKLSLEDIKDACKNMEKDYEETLK